MEKCIAINKIDESQTKRLIDFTPHKFSFNLSSCMKLSESVGQKPVEVILACANEKAAELIEQMRQQSCGEMTKVNYYCANVCS
jgi:hypothetical protein